MARVEITDIRVAERMLKDLDQDYLKEFRKDVRDIAKPLQKKIKAGIKYSRMNPPIRGMKQVHFGRVAFGTTWGGDGPKPKPAKSALIQRVPERARRKGTKTIVRVVVGSPGTVLADMAGSGNMRASRRGQMTREYDYMYADGPGKRRHRITSQGIAFVDALNARYGSTSSRFVWPAAEKAYPEVRDKIDDLITKYNKRLNAKLRIMTPQSRKVLNTRMINAR